MIRVEDLAVAFGERDVFWEVSFELPTGGIYGLVGRNGSGKTTLLRTLAGELPWVEGSLTLDGEVMGYPFRPEQLRRIGWLPEPPPLYTELTTAEHLALFADLFTPPPSQVEEWLTAFDLHRWKDTVVGQLSKGTRQRLGLVAVLMQQPSIVLLDEPFTGLDPSQREALRRVLASLGPKVTQIVSTHHLAELRQLAHGILSIADGEVTVDHGASAGARLDSWEAEGGLVPTLELRFSASQDRVVSVLRACEYAENVEVLGEGWYAVAIAPQEDSRDGLLALCAEQRLGFLEMRERAAVPSPSATATPHRS